MENFYKRLCLGFLIITLSGLLIMGTVSLTQGLILMAIIYYLVLIILIVLLYLSFRDQILGEW